MKIIKKFLTSIGFLVSFIYSYKIQVIISHFLINYLYSGWVKRSFGNSGQNLFIRRPLYLYGGKFVSIGSTFRAERGLRLEAHQEYNGVKFNPQITIGDRVSINFNCHIAAVNKITIGNDVLIASNVLITDHYHGEINKLSLDLITSLRVLNSTGPVIIQENVWIGENVCIMPNLTIGKGCVIGANAVVTKSFPAGSIIGGIPAKLIKTIS